MKNKKGNAVIVGIIILVVAIVAGAIGYLYAQRKVVNVEKQPVVSESIENKDNLSPGEAKIVYTNTEYGFEITLPSGWEGYRPISRKDPSAGGGYVYIDLPTSDKTWPGDINSETGQLMMGYASMFAVSVWDVSAWNKHQADCEKEISPDCAGGEILAKGNIYVYEISSPQAMPEDLIGKTDIRSIKESFRMIPLDNKPLDISNWQTYRNEKHKFEFQYPSSWNLSGSRLSPQKIEDSDIGSDNAPIHFGLYTENTNIFLNGNGDVFDFGDIDWKIKNLKRKSPDSNLIIDSKEFKRYDLIDNGRYEGASAGDVIILVSPAIDFGDDKLFLAFNWEQYPGAEKLSVNNSSDFLNIISTLKFKK